MLEVKNEANQDEYYAIYTDGEVYPVVKRDGKYLITREHSSNFSNDWQLIGFVDKRSSRVLIKPEDALNITDWKYKNGNPRYTVVDYDHGSKRVWGGTASSQQLRSFSKVNSNQFSMISESRDWTPEEREQVSKWMKDHGNMSYEEFCKELELAKQGKSSKIKISKEDNK